MKKQEASYTAEAALLLPVILLALFLPVHLGYELYGQAKEASKTCWDEAFRAEPAVRARAAASEEIGALIKTAL